ncbi:MAG: lmo0937 family membrane protein [Mollicutes bacterium]|nr:lmo0937 family membrane protein [Mollicutes bacterium]
MRFLKWIGGIVVFFWLLGFIFQIGGSFIHIVLVIGAIIFIIDWHFRSIFKNVKSL